MSHRVWRSFDFLLLLIVICLLIIGVLMVYSATVSIEAQETWLNRSSVKQAAYALSGLGILLLACSVDYQILTTFPWLVYGAAVGALGLVAAIGRSGFGSQSWLSIRAAVQPSELAKVLMVLFMAKFLADREAEMGQLFNVLLALVLAGVPILLVYRQPDFGSAMVLAATCLVMLLMSGLRFLHIALLGTGALAIAPLVWFSMKEYMRQRILVFLNPGADVVGLSYNARQALISIGSGGWFGKGLLKGTQSQLYFLRVRHTDYVFSVLAEELGFLGALGLLVLFAALIWRILRAATLAHDTNGRLIATGMATVIFVQVFVNIAVNLNLIPTTGLTLPLVSYGGSSLWSTLLAIGLVENVVMRHRKLEFGF